MSGTLLHCPIRGPLDSGALELSPADEAERIDLITYLLRRGYPADHIAVERDVVVYDVPVRERPALDRAFLVAALDRPPDLAALPSLLVLGATWRDRRLFHQRIVGEATVVVAEDDLANLPPFGAAYTPRPITLDRLTPPGDLVGTLLELANVMRSHGVNDQALRYRETVKLLLARHADERAAADREDGRLGLQVYDGEDRGFRDRLQVAYASGHRLFDPPGSELEERTLRAMVRTIQGLAFSAASSETLQQVFMTFVPAAFKRSLDQYFTPMTLVETMVAMTGAAPGDRVADPAMGTGDLLAAARGARVHGIDKDPQAFDLANVNLRLHGTEGTLRCGDALEQHALWQGEIDVVLCNPPFGARTVDTRPDVLRHYDLGHVWERAATGEWVRTEHVAASQQLGILFLERSAKLLADGGRLAIIVPEGYLCTPSYGYVRQWLLDHLRLRSLVELPRRVFHKADADLRSNLLLAERADAADDDPIHAGLVRKVGYKLGKGSAPLVARDPATGLERRDDDNRLVVDTDFTRVRASYEQFTRGAWSGATVADIRAHPQLDMKPRRLMPQALRNKAAIVGGEHARLTDVAELVTERITLARDGLHRLVEGQDIRAVEGTVLPQRPARGWAIAERKSRTVFPLRDGDIVVGLVRPERRNIGMLLDAGGDVVGAPEGVAVVRARDVPQEWLFAALRSEAVRLQLWTESGGTSYGKLTSANITGVLLPLPGADAMEAVAAQVRTWAAGIRTAAAAWAQVGTDDDRLPILNSAIHGLEDE